MIHLTNPCQQNVVILLTINRHNFLSISKIFTISVIAIYNFIMVMVMFVARVCAKDRSVFHYISRVLYDAGCLMFTSLLISWAGTLNFKVRHDFSNTVHIETVTSNP